MNISLARAALRIVAGLAMLLPAGAALAHAGNSTLTFDHQDAGRFHYTAADPDGIHQVRVYIQNDDGSLGALEETIDGKCKTPVKFKIDFKKHRHDDDRLVPLHYIQIVDCQRDAASDWYKQEATGAVSRMGEPPKPPQR